MADLGTEINGLFFPNPVLPAAGPNVKTAALMNDAAGKGAGGIVSKTFSVKPARDPRPTIRKTACGGLLNCETWLEDRYENFIEELGKVDRSIPLIVSIGYSPEDTAFLGRLLANEIRPDAVEFSTHYTGSKTGPLVDVAENLRKSIDIPIWMKLSPGFPDLERLVKDAEPYVDAFVAVNSFGPGLDFDPEDCRPRLGSPRGSGWLSGPPILPLALDIVCRISMTTDKPVIGVGGISSGSDAAKFIMAGASLVQVCTAAIRQGPGTYGRIAAELNEFLDSNSIESVSAIKGRYINLLKKQERQYG